MTAEIELLPLPEGNVAHLIAAQDAEIKALEQGAWDTMPGRNAAAAIRERLGEEE